MLKYVLQRLGMMVLTLFVIVTLAFFVIRLMPGSPFDDPNYSPELIRMLEEKYRLSFRDCMRKILKGEVTR